MSKLVIFDDEVRKKILSGSNKLTKVVAKTMGPKGKNVMIGKFVGAPVVTKDGVSVAREIVLDDPFEDLACQLIKEASGRTADIAGDGTTTATVLSDAILSSGYKLLEEDVSPIDIRDGLGEGLSLCKSFITKCSRRIDCYEDIFNIASISANNDADLGRHIADAYHHAGLEGTVIAEANASKDTHVRYVEGLEIKSGFSDPRFLSKGQKVVNMENAFILCINRELSHVDDLLHLLNHCHTKNLPLLIMAKEVNKSALETLVANNSLGKLKCCTVEIPKNMIEGEKFKNLCLSLGTVEAVSEMEASTISEKDLGFAKRIEVGSILTKIFECRRDETAIQERKEYYQTMLNDVTSESRRLDIIDEVRFLNSKGAVLSVGYSTELELREKGDRIEDALWATRAALEDGIVPGGGITLLRCSEMLRAQNHPKYQKVFDSLADACMFPFSQICSNAGKDSSQIKEVLLSEGKEKSFGYDAKSDVTGNLFDLGVVDPVKVTLTALSNAVSIALVLINTESIVAEDPDKSSDWQPPAGWRPPERSQLNHRY